MRAFAQLYRALDATRSSRQKTDLMASYFSQADASSAAWAVYFLAGARLRRLVSSRALRDYAATQIELPQWLFEASYQSVGDLAETITLLLPESAATRDERLCDWVEHSLLPLRAQPVDQRAQGLSQALAGWSSDTRFVCLKLLTGGFRVGVSRLLVTRALAQALNLPATLMAQRLVGYLSADHLPTAQRWHALANAERDALISPGQPYPLFLAHALKSDGTDFAGELGSVSDWQFEYKYDGIRAQLVCRQAQGWLWSRGEELLDSQFPELLDLAQGLPQGLVLDGEILVWDDVRQAPAPFAALQQRLGRKRVSAAMLRTHGAIFMAYDLLEYAAQDCRHWPLSKRRAQLEQLVSAAKLAGLRLSPTLHPSDWAQARALQQGAREHCAEGLMLKQQQSRYGIGRTRQAGVWLKFKLEPFSIDAVLLYAQKGHGRRANLYTDYTFALWQDASHEPALVPIAKAYSGLTDEEIREVDSIVKKTILESFGPVRQVKPTLVFEVGFEGLFQSTRHKSGVALRFPRILRWRRDKSIDQANTLAELKALL